MKQIKDSGHGERQSLGRYLRSERENRGYSIEKLASITRLRPEIIKAIEKEEWDRMPAPVFIRGFIRSYIQALGLEKEKIFQKFKDIPKVEAEAPEILMPRKEGISKRFFIYGSIVVIFISLISIITIKKVKNTYSPITPSITIPLQDRGALKRPAPTREVKDSKVGHIQKVEKERQIKASPESTFKHTLICKAKDRCWLSISIDGLKNKEYMLESGDSIRWGFNDRIDLILGNAGGVELEYDGDRILKLGKKGEVKRISIPNDLKEVKNR